MTYFIIYNTLSTTFRFFIFAKKLNKTSGQTLHAKTQNPLYCGTEGVLFVSKMLLIWVASCPSHNIHFFSLLDLYGTGTTAIRTPFIYRCV